MFDELSSRFEDAVKSLKGEAKISENNINDSLNQVKRALLDADVSLSVVKEFISDDLICLTIFYLAPLKCGANII